ncbi:MAG: hypothetical protein K0Q43_217 [Ramlibacter sp.]|jgi:hypothetical protein|nr:hypothetical protein [Ramlibacter sp.]
MKVKPPRGRLAGLFLATFLVSCGNPDRPSDEAKGGATQAPAGISDLMPFKVEYPDGGVILGAGYDMVSGRWLNSRCVQGVADVLQASELTAEYSDLQDREQLMDALKVSASGGVGFGAAGASASVEFSRKVTIDHVRRNVLANLLSMRGGQILVPPPDAMRLALHESSKKLTLVAFRQECGDGFVSAIRHGARRAMVFTYAMDSKEIQESLKASAEGSYGPAQGKASMERLRESKDLRAQTKVAMFGKGGNSAPLPVTAASAIAYIENFGDFKASEAAPLEVVVTPYSALADVPAALRAGRLPGAAARALSAQYSRFTDLHEHYVAAAHSPSKFYHPFVQQAELGIYAEGIKNAAFCTAEMLTTCALDKGSDGQCGEKRLLELVKDKPYCEPVAKPDTEKTTVDWITTELVLGRKQGEPSVAQRSARSAKVAGAQLVVAAQSTPLPDLPRSRFDVYLEYFARAPLKRQHLAGKLGPSDEVGLALDYCKAESLPCQKLEYPALEKDQVAGADQVLAFDALHGYLVHVKLAQLAGAGCSLSLSHPFCQAPDTLPVYVPKLATFGISRGFLALSNPAAPTTPKTTPRPPRDCAESVRRPPCGPR